MTQQINLYHPILLKPRLYFSAEAMARALGLLLLGLLALAGWTLLSTHQLRAGLAASMTAGEQEKKSLETALAQRPQAPKDTTALQQEVAQAHAQVAEKQALLSELLPASGRAAVPRSAALLLLSRSLPSSVWLTEVRIADGRLELVGMTLQPEALRPWLAQLSAHPALAGQSLRAVKVERQLDAPPGAAGLASTAGAEAWRFRVVSSQPATGVAP